MRKRRLRMEALEMRRVLAAFLVTTVDDVVDETDSVVSLREAIVSANSNAEPDTITFDPAVFPSAASSRIELQLGQLEITDSVQIEGPGQQLTIDAQGNSRVIAFFASESNLLLSGLTITGGMTTADSVNSSESGGAIRFASGGTLSLDQVALIGNGTTGSGASGGAIFAEPGDVVIHESQLINNSTSGLGAHGGAIHSTMGTVSVTDSMVSGNRTSGVAANGGAMYVLAGDVSLVGSSLVGNRTTGDSSNGGGIYSVASVRIADSVVSGNITTGDDADGGAVFARGSVQVSRSDLFNNRTEETQSGGGAITTDSATVLIEGSSVVGNQTRGSTSYGGGLFFVRSDVTIVGSTVSGNSTIGSNSNGGGINASLSSISIASSTIARNTAAGVGGGLAFVDINDRSLTLLNSIVAENTDIGVAPDFQSPVDDQLLFVTFSLIGDNTGTSLDEIDGFEADGNFVGDPNSMGVIDPRLGDLLLAGGTRVHPLRVTSQAVNTGDNSSVVSVPNDQRGAPFVRIANATVDMGAFEFQSLDANSLVVTTTSDELDFSNSAISLREAISFANGTEGTDTIVFDPTVFSSPSTIALQLGELTLTDAVTMEGPGSELLTIDAGGDSRVLSVDSDAGNVTLNGLTLTGGATTGATATGAGIEFLSNGVLTVDGSVITGNSTQGDSAFGAGIYSQRGRVFLNDSTISNNSTVGANAGGGGIHSVGGVVATMTTISDNSTAGDNASGGGAFVGDGEIRLLQSSLTGNVTSGDSSNGGGLAASGFVQITNSTISQNTSAGSGGGVFTEPASAQAFVSSTIVSNVAAESGGGLSLGANQSGALSIQNSIVAQNMGASGPDLDLARQGGSLSLDSSLIGDNSGTSLAESQSADSRGNLIGSAVGLGAIDPMIGGLSFHGGATQSHRLLPGSPAIDSGDNLLLGGLDTDQRGAGFARVSGSLVDRGSFEAQPIDAQAFVVNTTEDELDFANSVLSLREALELATASSGTDTITFDPTVFAAPSTINLTLGELVIADSVSIAGPGQNSLTVDAQGNSRVLNVVASQTEVMISDLTLSGGRTTGDNEVVEGVVLDQHSGAGIRFGAAGVLTLENVTVANSQTTGANARGGGVYSVADQLTLIGTTITDNVTQGDSADGGGLFAGSGTVVISASTFRDNATEGAFAGGGGLSTTDASVSVVGSSFDANMTQGSNADGGGIETRGGSLAIEDSTLTQNGTLATNSDGGGVFFRDGLLTILSTTLDGNTTAAANSRGGGFSASFSTVLLEASAVVNNGTSGDASDGAGIAFEGSLATFVNSTLSGNTATGAANGGAIAAGQASTVSILNSTLTANSATADGGGIHIAGGANEMLTIANSIVAANSGVGVGNDIFAPSDPADLLVQFSLIGDNDGTTLLESQTADTAGNLIGALAGGGVIDPQIGPLQVNGGTVPSHKPLVTSPVIDGGSDALAIDSDASPLVSDGRGIPFLRFSGTVDIGAFEAQPPIVPNIDWADPANLFEGTPLSSVQLNAISQTAGSFTYSPPAGTVLSTGNSQLLMVTFTPDDTTHYVQTTASVRINVVGQSDRGDAPDSYSTLLASDGPTHVVGALSLGDTIDADVEGQPSADAGGDGADEDGVAFITGLVADVNAATTGTIAVTVSRTSKLDAWIDFDGNGRFDTSEHLGGGTSIDVITGLNRLSVTVPAGATPGVTYARFRVSNSGGLLPTGTAIDGEVEDYVVTLLDASTSPTVGLTLPRGPITLFADAGDLVVQRQSQELFRAPSAAIGRFDIIGDEFSNVLTIDSTAGRAIPTGGLAYDGIDRVNTVRLIGANSDIDLSRDGNVDLRNIAVIDMSDAAVSVLRIDGRASRALAPGGGPIIVGSTGDSIVFTDADQWRMAAPVDVAGISFSVVTSDNTFVQVDFASAWQNLPQPSDVNNDGNVTAGDALRIINELSRRTFSDANTTQLADPATISPWPGVYFDQNGDGASTALDALRVINEIARRSNTSGSGEPEQVAPQTEVVGSIHRASSPITPLPIETPGRLAVNAFDFKQDEVKRAEALDEALAEFATEMETLSFQLSAEISG
ncbi:MAG: choice-of-anchor Q domain-containing protein [Rubripirellula sp.]